ncbi:hypothetical protein BASA83_007176 [Batrachochytrium salamandrivorans]|nr:hypothetical protein BASA83_007176 [Batrachochytrium salamandrivorans]
MFGIHPRLPYDETPPRSSLTPLDDIEQMEENSEFIARNLEGSPYHVVDVGHPGTYWIMTPQGLRLPNAVNQNDLAPWLSPVVDNVDFFYDGTSRNSGSF